MQLAPLLDVRKRPLRHFAAHVAGPDIDRNFEFAMNGIKVRRAMVSVVHGDDDSEEATELWHSRRTCPRRREPAVEP